MRAQSILRLRIFLLLLVCGLSPLPTRADDVGITNARLIEIDSGHYVLETNIPYNLYFAIAEPVLPARFQFDREPEIKRSGNLMRIRYHFSSPGGALNSEDVIILPWKRSAVFLAAQWQDGTTSNGLFSARLDVINVPIGLLRSQKQPNRNILTAFARKGLHHVATSPGHWLLLLILSLIGSRKAAFGMLLAFFGGQAISLIAVDLGISGIPLWISESLILFVVLIMIRRLILNREAVPEYRYSMILLGFLHGLGLMTAIPGTVFAGGGQVIALFAMIASIEMVHFLGLALLTPAAALLIGSHLPLAPEGGPSHENKKGLLSFRGRGGQLTYYGLGSMVFAFLLSVSYEGMVKGQGGELNPREQLAAEQFSFQNASATQNTGRRPTSAPRELELPIASFLTIEAHEIRHEALIGVKPILSLLDFELKNPEFISVEEQNELKNQIEEWVIDHSRIEREGQLITPAFQRADFVQLGITGAIIRTAPEPERIEQAVVGVVMAYSSAAPPKEVGLTWEVYPATDFVIPVNITDPSTSQEMEVDAGHPIATWKNDLLDFRVPEFREIRVENPFIPLFSIFLLLLSALLFVLNHWRGPKKVMPYALGLCLAVAFLAYPFWRTQAALPLAKGLKPGDRQAAEVLEYLLSNVYRSFEYRDEGAVYDRLALSITGDELEKTYLEQRRGLEIENRGGARARVYDVEVLEIEEVKKAKAEGFNLTGSWRVSGSVSHFGHMHYRQNIYQAIVKIVLVDGTWKIESIELLDEQRIL